MHVNIDIRDSDYSLTETNFDPEKVTKAVQLCDKLYHEFYNFAETDRELDRQYFLFKFTKQWEFECRRRLAIIKVNKKSKPDLIKNIRKISETQDSIWTYAVSLKYLNRLAY